jgi:hypothetical protein
LFFTHIHPTFKCVELDSPGLAAAGRVVYHSPLADLSFTSMAHAVLIVSMSHK